MTGGQIVVKGARVHNLKNISLSLPRRRLVVVTGPSGSGKSSLAFDTLYAEGQRRYIESLSSFAHQFLDQLPKPDVDRIEGLSPALAIDQKGLGNNPRSTVGTVTEITNFLRLLFARCGLQTCPDCGVAATSRPLSEIRDAIATAPAGRRFWLLAPVVSGRKGAHRKLLADLLRQGFLRAFIDGEMVELEGDCELAPGSRHDIDVVIDGLTARPGVEKRIAESLDRAVELSGGTVCVLSDGQRTLFSRDAACPSCGRSFPEPEPRLFSFNSPAGSCPDCQGMGTLPAIRPETLVPDPALSLADGAIVFLRGKESGWLFTQIEAFAEALDFTLQQPWSELPPGVRDTLISGMDDPTRERLRSHRLYHAFLDEWRGMVPELLRRHRETKSDKVRSGIEKLMTMETCPACAGYRLRSEALGVKVGGLHIGEASLLPITDLLEWASAAEFTTELKRRVSAPIIEQIIQRCRFLIEVGVGYLSLSRSVSTLSGGEGQRVRLATQVGSKLTGVLYILDEPSIGLHHRDIHRLIGILKALRDRGNSVIVVEHDLDVMLAADHVIDLGPGAGEQGGYLVTAGTPAEVADCPDSITGTYLAGRAEPSRPDPVSAGSPEHGLLRMTGLSGRNLKDIDLEIPLGRLTVVTGVSGSGKSTAVHDTLYRALAARLHRAGTEPEPFAELEGLENLTSVALVDQSPIGRTPRSTPATYTGLFGHVRKLFASTTQAKMRGYLQGRFSFNTGDGRCPECEGAGVRRLTMDFLPDVEVPCEACGGRRFNRETLEIRFNGRSIADVLEMPAAQALDFLQNVPQCRHILEVVVGVGLGYIRLGQTGATLSGGEAQRLKLARELSRGSRGRTLYILDEPTTGLHFCDVDRLMDILSRLVAQGHTVVVIEHNPEVIRRADRVIDLGPEGGAAGGEIVAQGDLYDIMAASASYTGIMLKEILRNVP